jgi:ABC-type spermidine/putrescine transport system permease subunit I
LFFAQHHGAPGVQLRAFPGFFADAFSWRVIGKTFRITGMVALVCLLIGYPVAFALARAQLWFGRYCWRRSSRPYPLA